jgi:hypothetical protein
MTAEGAGLSPAPLILIDSNPDAPFVPPGNMTGPTDQAVGLDDQFEPVWTFNGTAPFVLRQINYHDIFRKAREAFVRKRGALPFAPFGKFDRLDDKAAGASRS